MAEMTTCGFRTAALFVFGRMVEVLGTLEKGSGLSEAK